MFVQMVNEEVDEVKEIMRSKNIEVEKYLFQDYKGIICYRPEDELKGVVVYEITDENLFPDLTKREFEKCGWIRELFVAESAREQGIGTALLKTAMGIFKEQGVKNIYVMERYLEVENKGALAERFGFKLVEYYTKPWFGNRKFNCGDCGGSCGCSAGLYVADMRDVYESKAL